MRFDLASKVRELLGCTPVKIGSTTVAEGIKMICPQSALIIEPIKQVAQEADKYKVNMILQGLAGQNNVEKCLNELYAYVGESAYRAFSVSNLFRQALLSQSPIVCCIFGIMLSEHLDEKTDFEYEDLIIMNALQTASDYEIEYLTEILENYLDDKYVDRNAIETIPEKQRYLMTINWAINNRVLENYGVREYPNGELIMGDLPGINACTLQLKKYIDKAKPLMRYKDR